MQEYMEMLGCKATDRVTGAKGVITSISFDLYGCVQCIMIVEVKKGERVTDGNWFDAKRLKIKNKTSVMAVPNFSNMTAGDEGGPADKPVISSAV